MWEYSMNTNMSVAHCTAATRAELVHARETLSDPGHLIE